MGFGGINIWQLVIILVIVIMLFGTKRLRGLGGDLGGMIKGFKKAMTDETDNEGDKAKDEDKALEDDSQNPDAKKAADAKKSEKTK